MLVYVDSDYKCHVTPADGFCEVDVPFFDGKCNAFIEGYRYVPKGETWTNPQGVKCSGVSPWRDYALLDELQTQYEAQIAAAAAAYAEGVNSI